MSVANSVDDPIKRRDRYIMLGHSFEPKLFMLRDGNKWTLPHFVPDEPDVVEVAHIVRTAKKLWGIDATGAAMPMVFSRTREVEMRTEAIIAMENHKKEWHPPSGRPMAG